MAVVRFGDDAGGGLDQAAEAAATRVGRREGIAVRSRAADSGVRAPEAELILDVEIGDEPVGEREIQEREDARGAPDPHVALAEDRGGDAFQVSSSSNQKNAIAVWSAVRVSLSRL